MENTPSFEKERPLPFRTIRKIVLEILPTGEHVEEVIECNGSHHRKCVDEITYDSAGNITYADQRSRDELGECDCAKS